MDLSNGSPFSVYPGSRGPKVEREREKEEQGEGEGESLSSEQKGLMLETSAITLFTAFSISTSTLHLPH